jgi:hypothetical protein
MRWVVLKYLAALFVCLVGGLELCVLLTRSSNERIRITPDAVSKTTTFGNTPIWTVSKGALRRINVSGSRVRFICSRFRRSGGFLTVATEEDGIAIRTIIARQLVLDIDQNTGRVRRS